MSHLLSSIDARTKLVGENRLELLLFNMGRGQVYAINVFKIQEVMSLPKLTIIPDSHPVVIGVTHLRGHTIPVVDLSAAVGMGRHKVDKNSTIIVTEYNRSIQAFVVAGVERIINMNWEEIMPPPRGSGASHYLTAITKVDSRLVEIIDVEKVLAEIVPYNTKVSDDVLDTAVLQKAYGRKILSVDDSSVARTQIKDTISSLGLEVVQAGNGQAGLDILLKAAEKTGNAADEFLMVITDAEMPVMDGYRLTTEIRSNPKLADLYVVLHTSLSGSFNEAMVKKVGCNAFLSKFQPDALAGAVQDRIHNLYG